MQYNTQRKKMKLPEYGRSIQNMVDYAITIEDPQERQRCANTIISIMGNMNPQLRDVTDFNHKLWDHLAIMSDFKLDIEYPYEIVPQDHLDSRPELVSYPNANIKYRHYGRTVQMLINAACDFEEGVEKDNMIALIGNHMRKAYTTWNKDVVEEQKIIDDLYELSQGKLVLTPERLQLMQRRMDEAMRRTGGNNNKNNGKAKMGNNKNNRKRFDTKR